MNYEQPGLYNEEGIWVLGDRTTVDWKAVFHKPKKTLGVEAVAYLSTILFPIHHEAKGLGPFQVSS